MLPARQTPRFPNAPNGYLFAGDADCPAGGSIPSSWGSLRPELALPTTSAGKRQTTIRGGWGLFYQPPFVEAFNNMVDSAPFSPQVQVFRVPFMNPYQGSTNPFPAQFAPLIPGPRCQVRPAAQPGRLLPARLEALAVMNWNLTIEHQFHSDLLSAGRIRRFQGDASRLQHRRQRPAALAHRHRRQ